MATKDKGVEFSHGTQTQKEGMAHETNAGTANQSVTDEKSGSGAPKIEQKTGMKGKK